MWLLLTMMALPPEPFDFAALDGAIERCERKIALPVFAAEAQRRSAFLTAAYQEQAAIAAERVATVARRRALREAPVRPAVPPAAATTPTATSPAETDAELALRLLSLEDRQQALDEARRLEAMRQEAVDMKRGYFLTHCPSGKKGD
ncbi:hypothetical protein E2493_11365 [Sphingomonas parva]|uniref:Uncharacterized protein n=1 Tax=Sphingomonas parva TaxID=2555898 RepID=A0A4Y8ZSB1_9SPHN|nr:hypothetical protein [Sphingomonas parva]TFI58172.1 hypothetical protein E2493_11365 [Sphingomonas parva]